MFRPVVDNLQLIEPPNHKFPYCYVLYIEDEIKAVLDTSCGKEDLQILLNEKKPVLIVNTHFHEDHTLQNAKLDLPIWAHEMDAPAIETEKEYLISYGFYEYDRMKLGEDFIVNWQVPFCKVVKTFVDKEILDLGKTKLQVIHTPGHTPGHCCFYYEPENLLFGGDIELTSFGPWYAQHTSNIDDFIDSINLCIDINPHIFISAHKGILTEKIRERLISYRDKIYYNEEKILNEMRQKPHTIEELTNKKLYYGNVQAWDDLLDFMEKCAMVKHMERFIRHSIVKKEGDIYYLTN